MLYSKIIESKNGKKIPLFESGKIAASKYDPEKEGENFTKNLEESPFFLIAGLAAGYHILKLREHFSSSFILVIEKSEEDITWLKENLPSVQEIVSDPLIKITTIEKTEENLLNFYVPYLYRKFSTAEWRPWTVEIGEEISEIKRQVESALSKIKLDFGTQARFGKIWQHNILKNLYETKNIQNKGKIFSEIEEAVSKNKTACIIAAGPGLEKNISYLKENRASLYIISTDTAYGALLKNQIKVDVVVSIDGQFVSHSHFTKSSKESEFSCDLFVFSLEANPLAVRNAIKEKKNVIFSLSEHPLSRYIAEFSESAFIHLESGAGTVTISAIDFAQKCGFNKISVLGADFSYINGKTYVRGTYLNKLYQKEAKKTESAETLFSKLYTRLPLRFVSGEVKTTEVLSSYKKSFEEYFKNKNISLKNENGIYFAEENKNSEDFRKFFTGKTSLNFNYESFKKSITDDIKMVEEKINIIEEKSGCDGGTLLSLQRELFMLPVVRAALPFLAEKIASDRGENESFVSILKLAFEDIKRYTF